MSVVPWGCPNSFNSARKYIASLTAKYAAMYSASVDDPLMVGCFRLFVEIVALPSMKIYLVIDLLSSSSAPQSASAYPFKVRVSRASYLDRKSTRLNSSHLG